MKKRGWFGFVILSLILIMITALSIWMRLEHSGQKYYVRISNLAEEDDQVPEKRYLYQEVGFDIEGNIKKLEFCSYGEKIIEKDTYLVVVHNKINGVIRYSEIEREKIPQNVLQEMEKYQNER